jgi:Putative Flp pilus-assembly TadE/G-like
MRYRLNDRPGSRRTGAASIFLLVLLPTLLLAVVLGLFAAELVATRSALQNTADATALAAVQKLVDDRVLLDDRSVMLRLFAHSRREANRYHAANPVQGQAPPLNPNEKNDPRGDIVFGYLNRPRGGCLTPANLQDPGNTFLPLVNTVRVKLERTQRRGTAFRLIRGPFLSRVPTDLTATATALLDRHVYGFRPVRQQPIPMVPIAIRSGKNRGTWEAEVEQKASADQWAFDRVKHRFTSGQDGLPEMTVRLGTGRGRGGQEPGSNACLLQVGAQDTSTVARQVAVGIAVEDLRDCGGEFALGKDNKCIVPGCLSLPPPGTPGYNALGQALEAVRQSGEVRVWPLFVGVDPRTAMPVVNRFVAARVVRVESDGNGRLSFLLQPAQMSTVTALTDADRGIGENRYVCRVRLVE